MEGTLTLGLTVLLNTTATLSRCSIKEQQLENRDCRRHIYVHINTPQQCSLYTQNRRIPAYPRVPVTRVPPGFP